MADDVAKTVEKDVETEVEEQGFKFGIRHLIGGGALTAMLTLIPFLHNHEGERLTSYRDVGGVWTVCEGVTQGVLPNHSYTQTECDQMDAAAREQFMVQVMTEVPSNIGPKTLAAYTSFAYNIGINAFNHSSTRKLANQGRIRESCDAMLKWFSAGGKDCRIRANNCLGVWNRRNDERELCLEGIK